MDYKYIEQLLERYWNCETSVEEEQILRAFFRQKELPEHLLRYKPVFACQEEEKAVRLGDDFDQRILAEVERPEVKAKHLTLHFRFMPLFKAAAMMVLLFTIGGVVKRAVEEGKAEVVYVYDQFDNRTADPQVAEADTVKAPLEMPERSYMEKR